MTKEQIARALALAETYVPKVTDGFRDAVPRSTIELLPAMCLRLLSERAKLLEGLREAISGCCDGIYLAEHLCAKCKSRRAAVAFAEEEG